MKRHIIQCLVENKFGVLTRVTSLFSARGFNIKSLAVGPTNDPTMSVITMVVMAEDEGILEQIQKQLNKLIDIIIVKDLTTSHHVERELVLLKVNYDGKAKEIIDGLTEKYNFHMFDVKESHAILELTGSNDQIEQLISDLEEVGIIELIRTGKIAISS